MFFTNINLIAVLAAAIASVVIGFIWYSPWAFGKAFIAAMKYTPEEAALKSSRPMWRMYAFAFIGTLVTACGVAVVMNSLFVSGVSGLALAGLVLALGFVLPVKLNDRTFGRDSWTVFGIDTGFQAISIVIQAVIIGIFS